MNRRKERQDADTGDTPPTTHAIQQISCRGAALINFHGRSHGQVLNRKIVRSSGHRELDNEVISMIERAQPLPPFPASMPQAKRDLTVPIRFSLQ